MSRTVNHASVLGWLSHLGLAKAGHSELLAPRPTALPRAVVLGATTTALCCRHVRTADPPHIATLPLLSHHHRIHAGSLHLCVVAITVRVVGHHRHAIYGIVEHGPCRSVMGTRCP